MNEYDGGILDEICFPRNKDGWILVSQVIGHKVIVTSAYKPKISRQSNSNNQHREFVIELDTAVKVRPKLAVDFRKFLQERKSRN